MTLDGKDVLSLSSNNYLGLANDPAVKQAAARAVECYGCGAGASRLISGSMELDEALEREIAALKRTEAALLFSTGYHANIGVIPAVVDDGDTIFSDARNHAASSTAAVSRERGCPRVPASRHGTFWRSDSPARPRRATA